MPALSILELMQATSLQLLFTASTHKSPSPAAKPLPTKAEASHTTPANQETQAPFPPHPHLFVWFELQSWSSSLKTQTASFRSLPSWPCSFPGSTIHDFVGPVTLLRLQRPHLWDFEVVVIRSCRCIFRASASNHSVSAALSRRASGGWVGRQR